MREGVDASRVGHTTTARRLYLQALAIAQGLLTSALRGDAADDLPSRSDDLVAAFVVTHLNLADLCRDAMQVPATRAYLCAAHNGLAALMRDEQAPPALQLAACRHSRETRVALLRHLATHGPHRDIAEALHTGDTASPGTPSALH